jgi:hypothetical protein
LFFILTSPLLATFKQFFHQPSLRMVSLSFFFEAVLKIKLGTKIPILVLLRKYNIRYDASGCQIRSLATFMI